MQPRQNINEMFSTFLQFDADRFGGWSVAPQLQRSMQNSLSHSQQAETSESYWVLYWYKIWQTESSRLAYSHLSSYLQEVCYWSAKRINHNFFSTQNLLCDLFQIAIAEVDRVLRRFNPDYSLSLKNYASIAFDSIIKENLRQRQELFICSDWALLNRISQKRLTQSLQNIGLNSDTIAHYLLAWRCFKTVYASTVAQNFSAKNFTTRRLPTPNRATWQAIANLYNLERQQQLSSPGLEVNPEFLEKWMLVGASSARSYLYPKVISINLPKLGQAHDEQAYDIPADITGAMLTQTITEEEESSQEQQAEINAVLVKALENFELQSQRLLQMYYGQELTQQQIAAQLGVKQYKISRCLARMRKLLLLSLGEWSKNTLLVSPSPYLLEQASTTLEEWLRLHYNSKPFTFCFP